MFPVLVENRQADNQFTTCRNSTGARSPFVDVAETRDYHLDDGLDDHSKTIPWEKRIELLRQYYEHHTHVVQERNDEWFSGFSLGKWVTMLRKKRHLLSESQKEQLDALNFAWVSSERRVWSDDDFHARYLLLLKYKQEFHHLCIEPNEEYCGKPIGLWVKQLRTEYDYISRLKELTNAAIEEQDGEHTRTGFHLSFLTESRIDVLAKIGFWDSEQAEDESSNNQRDNEHSLVAFPEHHRQAHAFTAQSAAPEEEDQTSSREGAPSTCIEHTNKVGFVWNNENLTITGTGSGCSRPTQLQQDESDTEVRDDPRISVTRDSSDSSSINLQQPCQEGKEYNHNLSLNKGEINSHVEIGGDKCLATNKLDYAENDDAIAEMFLNYDDPRDYMKLPHIDVMDTKDGHYEKNWQFENDGQCEVAVSTSVPNISSSPPIISLPNYTLPRSPGIPLYGLVVPSPPSDNGLQAGSTLILPSQPEVAEEVQASKTAIKQSKVKTIHDVPHVKNVSGTFGGFKDRAMLTRSPVDYPQMQPMRDAEASILDDPSTDCGHGRTARMFLDSKLDRGIDEDYAAVAMMSFSGKFHNLGKDESSFPESNRERDYSLPDRRIFGNNEIRAAARLILMSLDDGLAGSVENGSAILGEPSHACAGGDDGSKEVVQRSDLANLRKRKEGTSRKARTDEGGMNSESKPRDEEDQRANKRTRIISEGSSPYPIDQGNLNSEVDDEFLNHFYSYQDKTLDEMKRELENKHPDPSKPRIIMKSDIVSGKGERAKMQNCHYLEMIRHFAPIFRRIEVGKEKSEQILEAKRRIAYYIALRIVHQGGCFVDRHGFPMTAKNAFKRVMTSLKDWRPVKAQILRSLEQQPPS